MFSAAPPPRRCVVSDSVYSRMSATTWAAVWPTVQVSPGTGAAESATLGHSCALRATARASAVLACGSARRAASTGAGEGGGGGVISSYLSSLAGLEIVLLCHIVLLCQ